MFHSKSPDSLWFIIRLHGTSEIHVFKNVIIYWLIGAISFERPFNHVFFLLVIVGYFLYVPSTVLNADVTVVTKEDKVPKLMEYAS